MLGKSWCKMLLWSDSRMMDFSKYLEIISHSLINKCATAETAIIMDLKELHGFPIVRANTLKFSIATGQPSLL